MFPKAFTYKFPCADSHIVTPESCPDFLTT
jgi:hypothetical protein